MGEVVVQRFGPFTRSVSAVELHVAPPETIANGQNMLVDPIAGGCFKRNGCLVDSYGETLNGATKRATKKKPAIPGTKNLWLGRCLQRNVAVRLEGGGSSKP